MIKRIVLIICFLLVYSPSLFSQDSIPAAKDLTEEKNLEFQSYFFKALSDKAIRNYQKAIGNLEMCNEILPNNPIVYFEFSKNYFFLNRNQLAKEYINRALEKKPNDIWMQLHLIKIFKKERDFTSAIGIQEKLANSDPKRKEELVYLYLQNRDYVKAISLMNAMESENGLSKNLLVLKNNLEKRKSNLLKKKTSNNLSDLISKFNQENSLKDLLLILEKSEKENKTVFHQLSEKGLELFPAQPSVYLYRAKSLNDQKLHKKALTILETGIDFIIDNPTMLNSFYREMANSYKSLGNENKYQEFINKIK